MCMTTNTRLQTLRMTIVQFFKKWLLKSWLHGSEFSENTSKNMNVSHSIESSLKHQPAHRGSTFKCSFKEQDESSTRFVLIQTPGNEYLSFSRSLAQYFPLHQAAICL